MNVDPMKDVTQKLVTKLKEGEFSYNINREWIKKNVEQLEVNERAFEIGLGNLRQSGEFAVPLMVDYLRDVNLKKFHSSTRRGLVRLGRVALNPLVAVLESKDPATQIAICGVLGDIGYDAAAPYMARLVASTDTNQQVKDAASSALSRLGIDARSAKPADLFYDLAEKFYYRNASIQADPRFPDAHIWYWDDAKGLTNKDVPPQIFTDRMSMRCAEYSLKLDPSRADTISLWLAANNKREADLPEGKTDASHEGPDAHYYNVALGPNYLNPVLQ